MIKKNGYFWRMVILGALAGLLTAAPSPGAIPASERAALIALYKAMNGDAWECNAGWKKPPLEADGFGLRGSEHTWDNIGVANDHVAIIECQGAGGFIPPEIGDLPFLSVLNLERSGLTGRLPAEIGKLRRLTYLDLRWNSLSGVIPPEIGNLKSLGMLILCRNRFSGAIPRELGQLTQLGNLRIRGSQLQGRIPNELGNLTNLGECVLNGNYLSGEIPASITRLNNLLYFSLLGSGLYTEDPVVQSFLDRFPETFWSGEKQPRPITPALIAKNSMIIAGGAVVHSGDVCVINAGGSLDLTMGYEAVIGETARLRDGAAVYAHGVKIKRGASVYDIFANRLANYGVVTGLTEPPPPFPLDIPFPATPPVAPGSLDVILNAGQTRVLPQGAYGGIILGGGAVLYLSGGTYHVRDVTMGDFSQILSMSPVFLVIQNRFASGNRPIIGPSRGSNLLAHHTVIQVHGENGGAGGTDGFPKAATLGPGHKTKAIIIVPGGTLWFKPRGDAEGKFYAKDIIVDLCSQIVFD